VNQEFWILGHQRSELARLCEQYGSQKGNDTQNSEIYRGLGLRANTIYLQRYEKGVAYLGGSLNLGGCM
jgi:hypothetical protein